MPGSFVAFFRQQWVIDVGRFLALFPWVIGPGFWAYQALSLPDDAVAFARPICERYDFIRGDGGSVDPIRLLGAEFLQWNRYWTHRSTSQTCLTLQIGGCIRTLYR